MSIYEQFNILPSSTDAVKAASIKIQPRRLCSIILKRSFVFNIRIVENVTPPPLRFNPESATEIYWYFVRNRVCMIFLTLNVNEIYWYILHKFACMI